MAFVLNASDIINFETMPSPKPVVEPALARTVNQSPHYHHPSIGSVKFSHLATSYMQVTDMRFEILSEFELRDVDSTDTININFFRNGSLDTTFAGLSHELKMRPDFHNLVYSPEGKDVSRVHGAQTVEMLHISLQRDFFISCLGHPDRWSERIIDDLQNERPFSGNKINPETTPRMKSLIDGMRNISETEPMKNLMIQSRILELLALQMDQFRTPTPVHEDIRQDEAEKLHLLKTYLDANFLSELNLTELGKICLLNEFKIKKGFKLLFGITVFNYLRKLRMEHAAQILTNNSTPVDEVADILGYEHSQHFSIAFKKYMGVSPSLYKSKGKSVR